MAVTAWSKPTMARVASATHAAKKPRPWSVTMCFGVPQQPVKAKKVKLVRDSYAMPEAEHQQIAVLKKRLAAKGVEVKKSELLRAGVAVLTALNDAELKSVMSHIERIKTGRPSKASKK